MNAPFVHQTPDSSCQSAYRLLIKGRVQGVGFRPFVQKLAKQLSLTGSVQNINGDVLIELRARTNKPKKLKQKISEFHKRLLEDKPLHAIIDSIEIEPIATPGVSENDSDELSILPSAKEDRSNRFSTDDSVAEIPPDLGICQSCVMEMFTPSNRRYLHPFINCLNCGPRYSVITDLPYDRARTSMAAFHACSHCQNEHGTQGTTRTHAQALSCHNCGPEYTYYETNGKMSAIENPILQAANDISNGKLVAIKGIGGIHLFCDAQNESAVSRLRDLKSRPSKPLAVMALNTKSAENYIELSPRSKLELEAQSAAIILGDLKQSNASKKVASWIAPGQYKLGCILPYAPIHYLLFFHLTSNSKDAAWLNSSNPNLFVCTSANASGEPLITDNETCLSQFKGKIDAFLLHNRVIENPSDDAVISAPLVRAKEPTIIRRGRGMAPASLTFPTTKQSILACGAHLKNTFCLATGNKAYLSKHMGELQNKVAINNYQNEIASYIAWFNRQPTAIACDAHPDFYSSLFAENMGKKLGVPIIPVQHHRAHISSVIAEHHIKAPILGLALDGVGLGDDGTIWGGELFHGALPNLERIGHFEPLKLIGGDLATKEIWRIGISTLKPALRAHHAEILQETKTHSGVANLLNMLDLEHVGSTSSSAGRWFDAAASIIGIRQTTSFEGQAAMELETRAHYYKKQHTKKLEPVGSVSIENNQLIMSDLVNELFQFNNRNEAAIRFHVELIDGLARWVISNARQYGVAQVVLTGGCFQNEILKHGLTDELKKNKLRVFSNINVPCNDAGISYGQAHYAAVMAER